MCEGEGVPKAHRWFFYSPDIQFKLEVLLAAGSPGYGRQTERFIISWFNMSVYTLLDI